jgi:hypothetical protein
MKKKILLIGTVLASTFSFGQSTPVSTTQANKNVILEVEKIASEMNLKDESSPLTHKDYVSEEDSPKYKS